MPVALGWGLSALYSFRRSRKTSFFAAAPGFTEYSVPACSPTKRRSVPGQRAIRSGWSNFTSPSARTDLNFGGGSGDPVTFEVVQGARFGGSFGFCFWLAARVGQPAERARARAANPMAARVVRAKVWAGMVGVPVKEVDPGGSVQSPRRCGLGEPVTLNVIIQEI